MMPVPTLKNRCKACRFVTEADALQKDMYSKRIQYISRKGTMQGKDFSAITEKMTGRTVQNVKKLLYYIL